MISRVTSLKLQISLFEANGMNATRRQGGTISQTMDSLQCHSGAKKKTSNFCCRCTTVFPSLVINTEVFSESGDPSMLNPSFLVDTRFFGQNTLLAIKIATPRRRDAIDEKFKRQEEVLWRAQRRTWEHEWRGVIFSDEFWFSLQHQDGRIHVWRHRAECILMACIHHHHNDSSPSVMVWDAIGYTSRSLLVRIDGTLNRVRYISSVLGPIALPFIQALRNPTFQQDNSRLHVSGIVRTFFDTENIRLLPWSAHSSDLFKLENVWSMVAERPARHHPYTSHYGS
ncbi:transposable element Tcb1 transposase [Trichonephila clavipes]|nr:transposable element Tcb1 transposase [Trichonephila clavipes]